VLIAKSALGYCIVGIHIVGFNNTVVATKIDDELITEMLGSKTIISGNPPLLQSENNNPTLSALHPKSCMRYLENGTAQVYGSFTKFRPRHKSKVVDTPIKDFLKEQYNITCDKVKPAMDWRPWRIAAQDCINIDNCFDPEILLKCQKSYVKDILKGLSKESKDKLHVYDFFTAVNGAKGVNYVDKINRNTSAGFPFGKSKKFYIHSIPEQHGLPDPVDVDDEIKKVYKEMLDRYKNGEISGCVFTAHLKDEPVSEKKASIGKTRVFSGANFPWIIIVRKYLLSFIRVVQENQLLFEAAPGIIAQSSEWEDLFVYLTKFGKDQSVAGDFAKFDKKMAAAFILAAFDIIIDISKETGNFTEEDLKVIQGIAYDTAFAFQDFNGDLIRFFGSNPSGHPLTVIINSLVNSLYQRYAYYLLNPDKEIDSFKENVNLITYGDDNKFNVSTAKPWFNHTSIADALATIGVKYTMAYKEAESVPYSSVYDTSFLKRNWLWNEETQTHLAPLDEESIVKSLCVWIPSKSITEEEQLISVIESANSEYFHYGRVVFEEKQRMLKDIVDHFKLGSYVKESTFLDYNSLLERYRKYSISSLYDGKE